MPNIELSFPDLPESFSVRTFRVDAAISRPFSISLSARSELDDAELDAIAGHDAILAIPTSESLGGRVLRWTGVCTEIELVEVEASGLSTYAITIAPRLSLLGHRVNCRVYRRMTAPDMALSVLRRWGIEPALRIDAGAYPVLDMRVQYNESDLSFVSRMLEEAGVSYFFHDGGDQTEMVLSDRPSQAERHGDPIPYHGDVSTAAGGLHVTRLQRATRLRSAAVRVRDYDPLRPSFDMRGDASAPSPGARLDRYEHVPGAAVAFQRAPHASSESAADPAVIAAVAQRRLEAARADRRAIRLDTNSLDLAPGLIIAVSGHPRTDIAAEDRLLVTRTILEGEAAFEARMAVEAVFASEPFRPPVMTPKPRVGGAQSATVVGPPGLEIHVDAFGRVRVQFPWDESGADADASSCWVRVSQSWAGSGFGMMGLPRVGDEVLVTFLDGDPDQPVIVGRLHNATHQPPFPLPRNKTKSGFVTRSTKHSTGWNELSFEDRAGYERVFLRAERDMGVEVQRNEVHKVGDTLTEQITHNRFSLVGGNVLGNVAGNVTTVTDGDETATVVGSRNVTVRGNAEEHVAGRVESHVDGDVRRAVAGSERHQISGLFETLAKGGVVLRSTGSVTTVVGKPEAPQAAVLSVDGTCHTRSSGVIEIDAEGGFELRCGDTAILVSRDGIELRSKSIRLRGEDAWITLEEGKARIHADEKIGGTSKKVVFKAESASLSLASEAKLDGTMVKLKSPDDESASLESEDGELTTIELVDQAGRPVPRARYQLVLDDGSTREGLLDDDGRAEVRIRGGANVVFPGAVGAESV